MNAEDFFGLQVAVHRGPDPRPRVPKQRVDPRDIMTEAEFKKHFRFSKSTFEKIVNMLEPDLLQTLVEIL